MTTTAVPEGATAVPDVATAVPEVAPTAPAALPEVAQRTLANGLRVMVVARHSVPLVELRLRIPFTGTGPEHAARADLLAETLFTGTAERDRVEIATAVQALGGALSTGVDADRLAVVGSAFATNLAPLLRLVAEVLTSATYPADEFAGERDRVVDDTTVAWSQPSVIARETLLKRLFGAHPYGSALADAAVIAGVSAEDVRALHAERVSPAGAILTLVGDVEPGAALDLVEAALGGWSGGAAEPVPGLGLLETGPFVIVDRPGAVQTNIRIGGYALGRNHSDYAVQRLANTIFGGYFSSRLVSNIREDKGYSYSPRSSIDHYTAGSRFTVAADVSTDVTGPALLEIFYELGRIALLAPSAEELDAARQYSVGTLALATATAAGLASTLSSLAGAGIGVDYLRDHPEALAQVTASGVREVSARVLAPSGLVTVLIGDAARIRDAVGSLGPVTMVDS